MISIDTVLRNLNFSRLSSKYNLSQTRKLQMKDEGDTVVVRFFNYKNNNDLKKSYIEYFRNTVTAGNIGIVI